MGCRSRSRTTSIRPIFRQPAERPPSRRIARNAMRRSCSACSMPAPSCSAKPICKSWPTVRPTTTRRLVRRATPTIPRAFRAARAGAAPPRSERASRRPQAGIVPLSHTRDTAGPMARHVADCVLLDGVVTGGPTEVTPAPLKGLRLGLPRGYFWENLDAELAAILEAALARLHEAGVVLVEGEVANVAALDAAAGFPIMLYETVIELERYLAEHETGLDFAGLMAQVKSPSVKQALASLRGADAVSEASYREALTKHRPALQETYRHYFRERGVAAMVFPTTPLPAAKIGEDDTVMLNGVPVSTLSTYIRNLAPGSAAGIPGLSLPAGMTKAGLPVGMAIDAPEKSDHQLLAIGLALETVLPRLPAPPA